MRAVRFDRYGGVDVLEVREAEDPVAGSGRVVVGIRAAGLNAGEIAIREGRMHQQWPATFPSGEGTDLAGVVRAAGEGVDSFSPGDEVLGWSDERSSHAELVAVPADQLTPKPPAVAWEVAGSLFVAGMAALASVEAVAPQRGETVVVAVLPAAGQGWHLGGERADDREGHLPGGGKVIHVAGQHVRDPFRVEARVPRGIRYPGAATSAPSRAGRARGCARSGTWRR